jgi:peptide/nickel transport system permease protein
MHWLIHVSSMTESEYRHQEEPMVRGSSPRETEFALDIKGRSLWGDAWRRLIATQVARLGIAIVILLFLMAVLPPILAPYDPMTDSDLYSRLQPPSRHHLFGTDTQGRDIFNRILQGAHISLGLGLGSVLVAVVIGTFLGLVSGFAGHGTDLVIMFFMDILLAFPGMLLAIALVALIGPGLRNSLLAISVVSIPVYARIARSTVLSLKTSEYVTAARCIGIGGSRILFRHVFPNSLPSIMVQATLGIASCILDAAGLGFLGLGAQPPTPEWGAMLADGFKYLTAGAWWVILFPGLAIMLTVFGFNLLGDGLRDALDPQLK